MREGELGCGGRELCLKLTVFGEGFPRGRPSSLSLVAPGGGWVVMESG